MTARYLCFLLFLVLLACEKSKISGPITDGNGCELPADETEDVAAIAYIDSITGGDLLGRVSRRWDSDSIFVRESTGLELDFEVDNLVRFSLSRPLKDSTPFFGTERRIFYISFPDDEVDTLDVQYSLRLDSICGTTVYDQIIGYYNGILQYDPSPFPLGPTIFK